MPADPFEKIGQIEKVGGKSLSPVPDSAKVGGLEKAIPDKEKFNTLMEAPQVKEANTVQASEKMSLMDEVRNMNARTETLSQTSPDGIRLQAKDLIEKIEGLKDQLKDPAIKIRGSVRSLLHNKLVHIDENLQIALNKVGIEYTPPAAAETASTTLNPIQRYIGYLTNSQYKLQNLSNTIEELQITQKEFSPANMLTLQIKMMSVSQQIEFFTASLNKAIESTKTLMNVQV